MNETSAKEISLKWLLYRALRAWKVIVICSVLVGLILGAVIAVKDGAKLFDDKFMNEAAADFELKHEEWETTKKEIENRIETLENSKEQQLEYNENSVLMQIDPFHKNIASVDMYIEYDYQIIPDYSYQPIDLSGRIVKSYSNYLTHGGMYKYVVDKLKAEQGYEIERSYLEELISISTDTTNRMISISVTHPDKVICEKILSYVKDSINPLQPSVIESIDDHQIKFINETIDEKMDQELAKLQRSNEQYVIEADTNLSAAKNELRELDSEPVFQYSTGKVVKDALKFAAIGVVATLVVLAILVMVAAMLSGKLLAPEDIKDRFDVRVIGLLPVTEKKKAFSGLSAKIAKLGGVKIKHGEYDELAKAIGADIKSNPDDDSVKTIVFTGNASTEEIEKAVAAMELTGYNAVCAPNLLTDSASIDKVVAAEKVVLVEAQEKSAIADIQKELEMLKAWNKSVLGAVVVNADALK